MVYSFIFLKGCVTSGIYILISTSCTRPLTGNPLSAQVPVLENSVIIVLFTRKHLDYCFPFAATQRLPCGIVFEAVNKLLDTFSCQGLKLG